MTSPDLPVMLPMFHVGPTISYWVRSPTGFPARHRLSHDHHNDGELITQFGWVFHGYFGRGQVLLPAWVCTKNSLFDSYACYGFLKQILFTAEIPSLMLTNRYHSLGHIFFVHYDSWTGRGVAPFYVAVGCTSYDASTQWYKLYTDSQGSTARRKYIYFEDKTRRYGKIQYV